MKHEVRKITQDQMRKALKRKKNRKAVDPDGIPAEVCKCRRGKGKRRGGMKVSRNKTEYISVNK